MLRTGWGQRGTEPELSGWAGPTLVEHIPAALPSLSRGSDPGSEGDEPPPLPTHFLLVGENTKKKKKSPVTLKEAVISFSRLKEFLQFNCQTEKDLWIPSPATLCICLPQKQDLYPRGSPLFSSSLSFSVCGVGRLGQRQRVSIK